MTGCHAQRVGVDNVVYRREQIGLHAEEITVAELLKTAGYATGIVGKWHLGEWDDFNPVNHGVGRTDRLPVHTGTLFNLKADPGETTDVAAEHPDKVTELNRLMSDFMKDLDAHSRPIGNDKYE